MSGIKWIKITVSMFDDEKIDFIDSLPEADAILVIWIRLLTLAGKCNAGGYIFLTEKIPYTDEMLAHKFRRPLNIVRLALETFKKLGMVEQEQDGRYYISNWEKHQNIEGMDKIREQTRKRVASHREKTKLLECNVTSNVTVTQSNALDIDIELDKEKDIKDIPPKPKVKKNPYADNVRMTEAEYTKLVDEHGEPATKEMIDILNNYKAAKGTKYKSDYHAILNWVVTRYRENRSQPRGEPNIIKGKNDNANRAEHAANMRRAMYS